VFNVEEAWGAAGKPERKLVNHIMLASAEYVLSEGIDQLIRVIDVDVVAGLLELNPLVKRRMVELGIIKDTDVLK
jgi:hypothetical protein